MEITTIVAMLTVAEVVLGALPNKFIPYQSRLLAVCRKILGFLDDF